MTDSLRRLAAILVADVVGYSKLVGADEAGTLTHLSALKNDVILPAIGRRSGRLFKAVGDGFLVEFASAVQAVTAAQEIQQANASGALPLRIGIHVGDVVVQGDDLMGDGVNIAARIEGVAEPGGIAISRAVHEQVRDKLDVAFLDKGEVALKNLARPVHVFAVLAERAVGAAMVPLALPDKPSIAVLPFQNMSGDPEQEYFVDGLVEDIITGLSVNKSLFVIARNSSFAYKGRAVDLRQVGRELGVRYVLEGSARKAGNRVRITGQLIDAMTGAHVWAEKFDGALDDIFDLQDQVAGRVIGGIAPSLELAEIERVKRKTDNLQAYDYLWQCRANWYRMNADANKEALEFARKSVALDPDFALGHAAIAMTINISRSFGWTKDAVQQDLEADRSTRTALELDRHDATVLAFCGQTIHVTLRRLEEGAALLDLAVKADPNSALAWLGRASTRIAMDAPDEAIENSERALRLSPLDVWKFYVLTLLSRAYNVKDEPERALAFANEARLARPNFHGHFREAILANIRLGRMEQAKRDAAEYARLIPSGGVARLRQIVSLPRRMVESYAEALRAAGIPE